MAKQHIVKCCYCDKQFDANKENFVMYGRRYAHKICSDNANGVSPFKGKAKKDEDPELTNLKEYISTLFEIPNWAQINRQIKQYKDEYGYSYSGIKKSLIYFYEVKKNDKSKSNNAIGIVPFVYQDAYQYYLAIFMAQNQTQNITFIEKVKEYIYKPRKPHGTKKLELNWGEEDEE